jgi:hypothetical protein
MRSEKLRTVIQFFCSQLKYYYLALLQACIELAKYLFVHLDI